jgi:hypothetical protein
LDLHIPSFDNITLLSHAQCSKTKKDGKRTTEPLCIIFTLHFVRKKGCERFSPCANRQLEYGIRHFDWAEKGVREISDD